MYAVIDRCASADPPCDENARCLVTGPAQFECICQPGHNGDGFVCIPTDPCQTDAGGCPVYSTSCVYLGPGQVRHEQR